MDLTPTERDRLEVFVAAQLARATLDRGLDLNAPEAIAYVCDELHLAARSGASYDDVVAAGRRAADELPVLDGVASLVPEIRVEVLLDEGTRLIVLRLPFGRPAADGPGAIAFGDGDLPLLPDRERRRLTVTNGGARPVRVSSHYPLWRANPSLVFDREAARGYRLDLPAGDHVRWGPGETRDVDLVRFGGAGGVEAGGIATRAAGDVEADGTAATRPADGSRDDGRERERGET